MKARLTLLLIAAGLVGPLVTVVRAEISADEIRKAIHDGVKYLESQQRPTAGGKNSTASRGG